MKEVYSDFVDLLIDALLESDDEDKEKPNQPEAGDEKQEDKQDKDSNK